MIFKKVIPKNTIWRINISMFSPVMRRDEVPIAKFSRSKSKTNMEYLLGIILLLALICIHSSYGKYRMVFYGIFLQQMSCKSVKEHNKHFGKKPTWLPVAVHCARMLKMLRWLLR